MTWYESLLSQALDLLTAENYPEVCELLRLPDEIRGYEQVKRRSVIRVKKKADEILAGLLRRDESLKAESRP